MIYCIKRRNTYLEALKKNKNLVILITYTVFLVYFLFNVEKVNAVICSLFSMMMPVIYGIVFAFLVGLIARGIKMLCYNMNMNRKAAEASSIVVGYLIFLAVIIGFFFMVIPALNRSIRDITSNLPTFWSVIYEFIKDIARRLEITPQQWDAINEYINQMYSVAYNFLTSKLPDILSYAFNLMNFLKNLSFGFVISVYILTSRRSLSRQIKMTITVLFSEDYARKIIKIGKNANRIFRKYISGQVIVSVILGVVCYICMLILKMPDAVLVSLIIGMSNLVPIVGPIVGCIPTTLIVMMKSPIQGLWFLALVILLQQLENNILSPKIIGDSVGIGGLWVMIAIIIGGGFFGVGGMIIAVPTMGVIYHLLAEYINNKYDDKRYSSLIDDDKR